LTYIDKFCVDDYKREEGKLLLINCLVCSIHKKIYERKCEGRGRRNGSKSRDETRVSIKGGGGGGWRGSVGEKEVLIKGNKKFVVISLLFSLLLTTLSLYCVLSD
jgi:hypothetical protein